MVVAVNPDFTFDYSLRGDASPEKTTFILGVVDSFARAHIDDTHSLVKQDDGTIESMAIANKYIGFVKFGLKGWKNFKDADGKDVEFKTEEVSFPWGKRTVVSDESIKKLDLSWIIELGLEILVHNKLSGTDS